MEFLVRFLVEPVIVMFMFASMVQVPLTQQYVYKEYSKMFNLVYEFKNDTSSFGLAILNFTQRTAQEKVQTSMAHFSIGLNYCWSLATIIGCLFYGTLSDRIGRRFIFLINSLGSLLESSLMLLGMILGLPVYMFYVGVFISGLSGAYNGIVMIAYAYLGDITTKEQLPIRIAILKSMGLIARCSSFYAGGAFIQKYGFIPPQILVVAIYLAVTLYIAFVLKESHTIENTTSGTSDDKQVENVEAKRSLLKYTLRQFYKQPKILWGVLTKKRPKRSMIYLIISILTVGSCLTVAMIPVITDYLMNRPFCFPPTEIGKYFALEMLATSGVTFIFVKVFLRYMSSYLVAIVSPIFGVVNYLMLLFAKSIEMVYGALGFRAFTLIYVPIFRAALTGMIGLSEQGSIYSAVAILDTVAVAVGGSIFNFAYSKLIAARSANLFFYIPSVVFLIPLLLILVFWCLSKRTDEKQEDIDLSVISNPNAEQKTEIQL